MSAGGASRRYGGDRDGPRRRDLRPRAERHVRRAWRAGAGPGLRLGAALFGLASRLRQFAHEAGLAERSRPPGTSVLSVGSLAVGGSGKTPVAAAAARWASELAASPAVVTPGFPDEIDVHRSLNSGIPAVGDRDRLRAARRAARLGADFLVVDDGHQHRSLGRDLDWVVLDEERAASGRWDLFPAGPGREAWDGLARADAVILTRRTDVRGRAGGGGAGSLPDRLARQFPAAAPAGCELRPGPLLPVNAAARSYREPRPRVAFASVMNGEDFLQALAGRRPEIEQEFLFSDHAPVPDDRLEEMIRLAGEEGIVGTRKDVHKVAERVGDRVPLWRASEELRWTRGEHTLRRQIAGLGGGR